MSDVVTVQNKIADKLDTGALVSIGARDEAGAAVFLPQSFGELMEFAKLMSIAHGAVPPHLRGKTADCLAVAMQAMRWQMDPFAVAQKTFFVNDRIAYEAQLVIAVINTRAPLEGRLDFAWDGEGENLKCTVTGKLKGDPKPKVVTQEIKTITTKNSPLWKQAPRQQLGYFTARMWGRLHVPEVMLGVYTPDELQDGGVGPEAARDVTPPPPRPTRAQFQSSAAPVMDAAFEPAAPVVDVPVDDEAEDEPELLALVDEHGEIVREFKSASDWLLFFRDALRKAGNKLAAWEGNEAQFDHIKEMVEAGDEVLAEIYAEHFQQVESGGESGAAPEPSEWDDELAELKRVGSTCQNFGQWTAFLEDYAGRITAMQAGSEAHKAAWIEFAKARMGEFQSKAKGAKQ